MKSKKKSYSLSITLIASILFSVLFFSAALVSTAAAENLTVNFIDVGQGDSILLEYGDSDMLIDAGDTGKGDDVADYVKGEGITSLDYVVATHPHSDHIGGMSVILDEFSIGNFIDSGYPYTTKTYENMLAKIDNKNIPFKTVKRGDQIDFASGVSVEVLNPGSTYFDDDLNQNSVVLKVTDGQVSFLLTGDAGKEAENAIMKDGYDVNDDILKVGHHGSRTASGSTFISSVSPEVSVIEVGEGNEYGHPHKETLETLQKVSTVYRTDIDGTVTITTDGSTYSVTTENTVPVTPPVTVLPIADFSTSITEGTAPLEVKFTDLSQNAVSWNWDFDNNGRSDSTVRNPVYVYENPGTYTVNLTVSNAKGTDSKLATITVLGRIFPPAANFTSNVTSGYAPLTVQFTDLSKNATSWKWTFGDGRNSIVKNPVHRYSTKGNYTVTLTASNSAGSNTTRKTNYIKVTSITRPVANFTSNVTSGTAPLTVSFTDISINTPTSWRWTFGDGTNSTSKDPIHRYSTKGNYTVSLTATNTAGSNTTTKTNYIKVTTVVRPVANFTSNITSGYVPLTVAFTDKSTNNPTSWRWTFGDGIKSTVKNPVHRYSTAGNYTVALTVSNSAGRNTTTKTNCIEVIKR